MSRRSAAHNVHHRQEEARLASAPSQLPRGRRAEDSPIVFALQDIRRGVDGEEPKELITGHSAFAPEIITVPVLKLDLFGLTFAYAIAGNSIMPIPHVHDAILNDIDDCGFGSVRAVPKTEREPALLELRTEPNRAQREIDADANAEGAFSHRRLMFEWLS